ncbi:MAG: hypothetical protein AB7F89_14815, partial [Pirellulaceae bacterium]
MKSRTPGQKSRRHHRARHRGPNRFSYLGCEGLEPRWLLASLTVDTALDVLDGNTTSVANLISTPGSDGRISLREAVIAANATPGEDTIQFAQVLDGTSIQLSIANPPGEDNLQQTGDLEVWDDLVVEGNGQSATVIHAGGPAVSDRIFDVLGGASLTVTSLTLTGGRPAFGSGGAVLVTDSNLILQNTSVTNNSAQRGGGVAIEMSSPGGGATSHIEVSASTISGNTAAEGGGLFIRARGYYGYLNAAHVAIKNSTIAANTTSGRGGGVFHEGGPYGSSALTIADSTISGNTAVAEGGGIFNSANTYGDSGYFTGDAVAHLTLHNSTISGNSGGALYNLGYGYTGGGFGVTRSATIRNSTSAST